MSAIRFRGPVLPDGEPRDVYVVDGQVTFEPIASAEHIAEGWIVPGLVDAHCHVGLDQHGAVDEETQEEQAVTDRDAGALLLRDCGSAGDTAWIHDRDDLPRLIRAGRHLARTKRYIRDYAHEVEPAELPAYVAQEAKRGDGWVKLVGDWIERDVGRPRAVVPGRDLRRGDPGRSRPRRQGHRALLRRGGPARSDRGGIDCIEHGTGLSTDLIDAMVKRGTALVPTVMQPNLFPQYADAAGEKFPAYAAHMRDLHGRRQETIMAAHEAGVPMYAGTDAGGVLPHGLIADEVLGLADYDFSARDALGAASWRAREWLGWNATLGRARPRTSWSTTATRSRTCRCSARRPGSCSAAGWSAETRSPGGPAHATLTHEHHRCLPSPGRADQGRPARVPRPGQRRPRAGWPSWPSAGIHDPATMPFYFPWTDAPIDQLARNTAQYHSYQGGLLSGEVGSQPRRLARRRVPRHPGRRHQTGTSW